MYAILLTDILRGHLTPKRGGAEVGTGKIFKIKRKEKAFKVEKKEKIRTGMIGTGMRLRDIGKGRLGQVYG